MDLTKFTERARGFIQAAQTIAIRENHQRILPEHILKALMDDDQGFATNLIAKAGGNPAHVRTSLDQAIAKLPPSKVRHRLISTMRRSRFLATPKISRKKPVISLFPSNAFLWRWPW
jgi:ATP-dependent Clp protease ATP-binding subunit ClpA